MSLFTHRRAEFSPCRTYRYWLEIRWDHREELPWLGWMLLNPSTADEINDDPTLRKVQKFARDRGFGGIIVCNVYALRSTDPRGLWKVDDPSGGDNDIWHEELRNRVTKIVAGWGRHARQAEVDHLLGIVPNLDCLKVNADGSPMHPLYVRADTPFVPYARDGKLVGQ